MNKDNILKESLANVGTYLDISYPSLMKRPKSARMALQYGLAIINKIKEASGKKAKDAYKKANLSDFQDLIKNKNSFVVTDKETELYEYGFYGMKDIISNLKAKARATKEKREARQALRNEQVANFTKLILDAKEYEYFSKNFDKYYDDHFAGYTGKLESDDENLLETLWAMITDVKKDIQKAEEIKEIKSKLQNN